MAETSVAARHVSEPIIGPGAEFATTVREPLDDPPITSRWRDLGECGIADAQTPALALLTAMLKALIAKGAQG